MCVCVGVSVCLVVTPGLDCDCILFATRLAEDHSIVDLLQACLLPLFGIKVHQLQQRSSLLQAERQLDTTLDAGHKQHGTCLDRVKSKLMW